MQGREKDIKSFMCRHYLWSPLPPLLCLYVSLFCCFPSGDIGLSLPIFLSLASDVSLAMSLTRSFFSEVRVRGSSLSMRD